MMAWTVGELVHDLPELGQGAAGRTVVVGGRWGISNLSLAGDGLGPVELDLEDIGLGPRPRLLDLLIRCERELANLAALLRQDGDRSS